MHKNIFFSYSIVGLLCIYFCIGIFPFTLYETDALDIISGCKWMIKEVKFEENYYTYNFQSQPGIFFWVIVTYKLLNINLIEAYCFVSALFGFLFLILSSYFVSQLLYFSFAYSLLSLLLFQEIFSACFYMNSATGAAFFMMAAFVLILNRNSFFRCILASILLALSAWTRFDVIVAFPVIFLLIRANNFKERVILTLYIFIIFFLFVGLLFYTSNARNILEDIFHGAGSLSFMENQKTAQSFFSSQFARSIIGCFSILVLTLIVYGTYLIIRCKEWKLLGLYLLPILFFMLILGARVVAGKHILYYTPFLAFPVIYVFKHIIKTGYAYNKKLLFIISMAFFFQYIIGFQFLFSSHPYSNDGYVSIKPYPIFSTLLSFRSNIKGLDSLKIVIGGGTKLSTSDEMLLSSGILFSPLMWHQLKRNSEADYKAIADYVTTFNDDTLHITTSQGGVYPVKNILYLSGYTILNPESKLYIWGLDHQYVWKKNNKIVIVDQATYSKESYEQYISKLTSFRYKRYLHIAFWDWERWYLNRHGKFFGRLHHVGYLFLNQ
ncbi:hypothetical protein ACS5NO_03685 [Larkinella sp. GY13]|uniref:hypothetical protein n=1 Tax=Larkinella sp. GY13 TaxID=3453720 RepID=UPI003EEA00DB